MSLASQLAQIIQQEAHTRGQLGIQKAGIMSNAIGQGADTLGGILGQMEGRETRQLQNEGMRTENEARKLRLSQAQAEQEYRIQMAKAPTKENKLKIFEEYLSIYKPEALLELKQAAQGEAIQSAKLMEGQPGRNPMQAGVEAQLPGSTSSPVTPIEQQQVPHNPITIPGVMGPDTTVQSSTQQESLERILAQKKAEGAIKREDNTWNIPGMGPVPSAAVPSLISSRAAGERQDKDIASREKITTDATATRLKAAQYGASNRSRSNEDRSADIKDLADAIERGDAAPDFSRLYRDTLGLKAELGRRGYNASQAEMDWKAVNKHLATLNGAQQERLRQAISFTKDTIPQIESAYAEWKKQAGITGFKVANKVNLIAMSNLPGKAGSAALNLQSLMADFTSELGTVYKGGNSSTDESLKLAAQNLKGEWNEQTFSDALKRINASLNIRENSMKHSTPAGVKAESPYLKGRGESDGGSDIKNLSTDELLKRLAQ